MLFSQLGLNAFVHVSTQSDTVFLKTRLKETCVLRLT